MPISVQSRAHRVLRHLTRYKTCGDLDQLPQLDARDLVLQTNETLIGVYENVPGHLDELLLFTNLGFHLWENDHWRNVKYAELAGCEWPAESKREASMLTVRTKAGERICLPVRGGNEFGRDLFGLMRFFDRVIDDIEPV